MYSKEALDKIIRKSRVHFYKPIQIAEILFKHRSGEISDLEELESYRNISKKWRDEVSKRLVGRISTSSQKFQDNLFEKNAMPPNLLKELGKFNKRNKGIVEVYIYDALQKKLAMVSDVFDYLNKTDTKNFKLDEFLSKFDQEAGLKRSVDKAYEIAIYSLFSSIIESLKIEINVSAKELDDDIISDFEEFLKLVIGISKERKSINLPAKFFRLGVTNAADAGLDMWTNFGPAIQVKHINLKEEVVEEISEGTTADDIIIVCLDAEKDMIKRVTKQLPSSNRIQGIITISNLKNWYDLCLSPKYRSKLGTKLLEYLKREFNSEFPVNSEMKSFLSERSYSVRNLTGEWTSEENN